MNTPSYDQLPVYRDAMDMDNLVKAACAYAKEVVKEVYALQQGRDKALKEINANFNAEETILLGAPEDISKLKKILFGGNSLHKFVTEVVHPDKLIRGMVTGQSRWKFESITALHKSLCAIERRTSRSFLDEDLGEIYEKSANFIASCDENFS